MKRILITGTLLLISCQSKPQAPTSKGPGPDQGNIVAEVGDLQITDKMVQERITNLERSFPVNYSTHNQKKQLVQEMMNIEVLFDEAVRQGYDKSFAFKANLVDAYISDLARTAADKISRQELLAFYELNRKKLDRISARHILILTPKNATEAQLKEKRKRIEEIRQKVLKDPSNFPNIAKEFSEDSSKDSGGELGFFPYDSMVKPFAEAAFGLKKIGEISPVVQTDFGFHIIQLTAEQRSLSFFEAGIRDQLVRKEQAETLNKVLDKLKIGVKFQIYEDALLKMSPLPKDITTDPADFIPEKEKSHSNK